MFPAANPYDTPKYRLSFRIPQVAPGRYAFVIYCGPCAPGPEGGLIDSAAGPEQLLLVGSRKAVAPAERKSGAILWMVAGAGISAFGLAGLLLFGRRRWRNWIFR